MNNIQSCFAYNGFDFALVDEATAVQVAGSAIVLWNTTNGKKDYIWSKRNGYCMVTSNYNNGFIAAAEYGLNPEVHIYRAASKELVYSFSMDTTVKCIGMAFSRDGRYLLMVGGVPDFKISIFDVENNKKLVMPETKLPCKPEEFLQAKFNPGNRNQFCVLSQSALYLFTVAPAYDVTERGEQKILGESYRLDSREYRDENPDLAFVKFVWDGYNQVHICTDQPLLIQVDPFEGKLTNSVNLSSKPACCSLTQKHMLISLEEGLIQWLKLELPEVVIGDKAGSAQHLKVLDEVEQEFRLGMTIGETGEAEFIAHLHYSRSFKQLVLGTETGVLGRLEVEAEMINYDEEEDEGQQQKEKKILSQPFIELGRFHTNRVTGIKELGESTQLITVSEDHYMSVWEATTQQMLASVYQPAYPCALDVTADGTASFIGTAMGAFRVYDLTEREAPRLVQQIRFFEAIVPIDIVQASRDGKYVLVTSKGQEVVHILSAEAERGFSVLGFVKFDGHVQSASFTVKEGKARILAVLSNSLLAGANVPQASAENRMEPYPDEEAAVVYRKIDRNSRLVITNYTNGDIFVSGDDKLLKKYEYPTDKVKQIDFKRAPPAPVEELQSHAIGTTCWDVSKEFKQVVTGGKDGSLILRQMNFQPLGDIKAHAIFSGGVSALCFSNSRSTLYSAGGDGSFMAFKVGGKPNPSQPIRADPALGEAIRTLPEIERVQADQIKVFREILLEEFHRSQEAAKQAFRQQLVGELSQIKDKLNALLAENERVTDIERLDRDEFVIDVIRSAKVVDEGENECAEIRKEAERTVLRLELLRHRVKQSTWDKMEIQQKAVKSIQSDTLIFNYPVRTRTPVEARRLAMITNARKIELTEKLDKIEEKLKEMQKGEQKKSEQAVNEKWREALEETEFSKSIEEYIMNRVKGKPRYLDDDSIREAAEEFLLKDLEKKARKDKMEAGNNAASAVAGKKQPILKITKGKLGSKAKKKDHDDDPNATSNAAVAQREIRGMEEMYWRVAFQLKGLEQQKTEIAKANIFDLIYEPYELYCDVRKRQQIELLQAVVFELKTDFNKEFSELEAYKDEQIFVIKEKNELIGELLFSLKQEEELFEPKAHILEDPENIFKIGDDEIKVERYLTKEERAVLAEEKRVREAREAALKGDNVGQRGLKAMMGGTELNLKKDKGGLELEVLMPEDLVGKALEDMNDDEKSRLKEYEQKRKETKEKLRKAQEQELKKHKADIVEVQLRFEERLLQLFKKKLFIDVRVLEQELYVIRLVIMLHDGKETKADEKKYRKEMEKLQQEKAEKEEMINTFKGFHQDLEGKLADDAIIRDQEKELRKMFPDANLRQILGFVRAGKTKKAPAPGEVNQLEVELSQGIVDLDPFSAADASRVKEILKEKDDREAYDYERDNVAGLTEEDFERLVQERYSRAEMDKDKEKIQSQITQLNQHINFLEEKYREVEEKFDGQVNAQNKAADRIQKIRFNFEAVVYLKQGQVEVPQLPVATDYKDAILVSGDVIQYENKEIHRRGDEKVKLMNAISEFKTGLKRVKYQKERLDLEIKDFEERAKDVQLYRVTKQTQEIIQGKHQKKDEEDKKRLENQIKQLEENAQKRIKTINDTKLKLRREIREKRMESEQLETKARQLQNNVDQRKQIMSLKSNTMTDGDADPSKKIKEIAHKRKLLDIAKQQTEEIEVLRDELDRLRARTFPSFAHLHNKPGYPDEN